MAKIIYRLKSIKDCDGMLSINIECSQFGKSILICTNVRVFGDEWDSTNGMVVNNPNARKLNILIRKTLYQLEEYELDYDGEFTLSKLKEIWYGREASHDFYTMMEYQINHRDIRNGTKEIRKRVSAHVARHTCASRLVNKDVPVTTIQKVIGHRSLKMTMVYAKTNENTLVRQLS